MARRLVSVDEITLLLPPDVEAALKADLDAEFSGYVDTATDAASTATAASEQAILAAEQATAPTDTMVAGLVTDTDSLTRVALNSVFTTDEGSNDVGYDIIPLLGQSNMVGRGVPTTAQPVFPEDTRIFAFGSQGVRANTISQASEELQHWGALTADSVGPGMAFAREYARSVTTNRKVLLVPCAQGATSFSGGDRRWEVSYTPDHNNLYLRAIKQIENALVAAGPNSRIVGFAWHQGEGDSANANYENEFDALIDGIRAEFGVPEAWFVLGQMSPAGNALSTGKQTVNAIHIDTPRRHYYAGFAYAAYGLHNPGDTTHFNADGATYLGRNYFEALQLAKVNTATSTPVPPSGVYSVLAAPGTLLVEWERPLSRFTDFVVQHRLAGSPTWLNWSHTASLDNKAALTTYSIGDSVEVRVATINENGTSAYTDVATLSPSDYVSAVAPATPWRAYALRRVVAGYAGDCIRVQRASDNTTLEVGFAADGNIDEDAIRTFCAGTDGYVRAWYDQTGVSGLSQSTVGQMPKIVTTGVVLKENGRPVAVFDGTDDFMFSATTGLTTTGNTAKMIVHVDPAQVAGGRLYSEGSTSSDTPMYNVAVAAGSTGSLQRRPDGGSSVSVASNATQDEADPWYTDRMNILTVTDDKTLGRFMRGERVNDPVTTNVTGTYTVNRLAIGAQSRTTTTGHCEMAVSEIYFWQAAYSPEAMESMDAHLAEYFSIDKEV